MTSREREPASWPSRTAARPGRWGPAIILAVSLALLAAGCDEFVTYRMLDGIPQIEPEEVEVRPGQKTAFEVSGGKPPYTFSIASGGGSIDPDGTRAEYDAPDTPGLAVVRVTDDLGSRAEARVDILAPALSISPAHVSVNIRETVRFQAEGGYPPYIFSVVEGGGTIDRDSGIYTAPRYLTVAVVRVTDSRSSSRDATVAVRLPWLPFPLIPFGR